MAIGLCCSLESRAQVIEKADSIKSAVFSKDSRNPKAAAIMSAVIPGAGQAYNKKYWKVPIIYAGFGTLGYFFSKNNTEFQRYKTAYLYRTDKDSTTIDEFVDFFPDATSIKSYRESYRRSRDLCVIGMFGLYVLNIVDATVDAHLFNYDVSDDLTIRISPAIMNRQGTLGMYISVKF